MQGVLNRRHRPILLRQPPPLTIVTVLLCLSRAPHMYPGELLVLLHFSSLSCLLSVAALATRRRLAGVLRRGQRSENRLRVLVRRGAEVASGPLCQPLRLGPASVQKFHAHVFIFRNISEIN
jgi:hypothetical protein